jgi:hypothetical protein
MPALKCLVYRSINLRDHAYRQTVYRIKGDPAGAEAALVAWGM